MKHRHEQVPIPTRFLFIVLVPLEEHMQSARTAARCMGAAMSDEVFQDVAFKASSRQHLLDACDEFMHQVLADRRVDRVELVDNAAVQGTVLPPSLWDKTTRLEPSRDAQKLPSRRDVVLGSVTVSNGDDSDEEEENTALHDPALRATGR